MHTCWVFLTPKFCFFPLDVLPRSTQTRLYSPRLRLTHILSAREVSALFLILTQRLNVRFSRQVVCTLDPDYSRNMYDVWLGLVLRLRLPQELL